MENMVSRIENEVKVIMYMTVSTFCLRKVQISVLKDKCLSKQNSVTN